MLEIKVEIPVAAAIKGTIIIDESTIPDGMERRVKERVEAAMRLLNAPLGIRVPKRTYRSRIGLKQAEQEIDDIEHALNQPNGFATETAVERDPDPDPESVDVGEPDVLALEATVEPEPQAEDPDMDYDPFSGEDKVEPEPQADAAFDPPAEIEAETEIDPFGEDGKPDDGLFDSLQVGDEIVLRDEAVTGAKPIVCKVVKKNDKTLRICWPVDPDTGEVRDYEENLPSGVVNMSWQRYEPQATLDVDPGLSLSRMLKVGDRIIKKQTQRQEGIKYSPMTINAIEGKFVVTAAGRTSFDAVDQFYELA